MGELEVDFEVLKGDLCDEMLLGMDFLQEVDAILECGRGTLTIGGQTFSISLLRPSADSDKPVSSKPMSVRMITRSGKNTE
jgi:hypothetical protein